MTSNEFLYHSFIREPIISAAAIEVANLKKIGNDQYDSNTMYKIFDITENYF